MHESDVASYNILYKLLSGGVLHEDIFRLNRNVQKLLALCMSEVVHGKI